MPWLIPVSLCQKGWFPVICLVSPGDNLKGKGCGLLPSCCSVWSFCQTCFCGGEWGQQVTFCSEVGSYPEVGKQKNSWRLCLCLAPCNSLFLHPNYFSCVHCQALSVIFWLHLPDIMVKKLYGLLCGEEAARHPVALGWDIHQALPSVLSLKPLHQKTWTFHRLSCLCVGVVAPVAIVQPRWRWWQKQMEAVAIRREMWQQPAVRVLQAWMRSSGCMSGCLVSKQAFFPLLFLCSPVLWKKSKSRLQFSVGRKEGETVAQIFFRGYLRWFSDDGGRGVCQEVESYSVIPEPRVFQNTFVSHIMPTSWMLSSEMFPQCSCGALMRKSLFELQGLVSCLLEKQIPSGLC